MLLRSIVILFLWHIFIKFDLEFLQSCLFDAEKSNFKFKIHSQNSLEMDQRSILCDMLLFLTIKHFVNAIWIIYLIILQIKWDICYDEWRSWHGLCPEMNVVFKPLCDVVCRQMEKRCSFDGHHHGWIYKEGWFVFYWSVFLSWIWSTIIIIGIIWGGGRWEGSHSSGKVWIYFFQIFSCVSSNVIAELSIFTRKSPEHVSNKKNPKPLRTNYSHTEVRLKSSTSEENSLINEAALTLR